MRADALFHPATHMLPLSAALPTFGIMGMPDTPAPDIPVTLCLAAKDKGLGTITSASQYANTVKSQDCLTIAASSSTLFEGKEKFDVDFGPALRPSCYIKGELPLNKQKAVTFYFGNGTDNNYLSPCFNTNGITIMCDNPQPACQKWRAAM